MPRRREARPRRRQTPLPTPPNPSTSRCSATVTGREGRRHRFLRSRRVCCAHVMVLVLPGVPCGGAREGRDRRGAARDGRARRGEAREGRGSEAPGCAGATVIPAAPALRPVAADAVLCLVNAERAQRALRPVVASKPLTRAATGHSTTWCAAGTSRTSAPTGWTCAGAWRAPATCAGAAGRRGRDDRVGNGRVRHTHGARQGGHAEPREQGDHPRRALPRGRHRPGSRAPMEGMGGSGANAVAGLRPSLSRVEREQDRGDGHERRARRPGVTRDTRALSRRPARRTIGPSRCVPRSGSASARGTHTIRSS